MKCAKIKKYLVILATWMFISCLVPVQSVLADNGDNPFLHSLFSDHMVLQRDVENVIWGWTAPGEVVTVEISGSVSKATADSNGRWTATIKAFSKGGPYQIKIIGSKSVTLSDVYFGEVWLCSGQSNMAMQLPYVLNGDTEVKNSDQPNIRFFNASYSGSSTPQDTFGYTYGWQLSNPNTVGNLSAVSYFFARKLKDELDVPVGIICSAVGGTQIESWMSNQAFADYLKKYGVSGYNPSSTSIYYNGMISPLIPIRVKGVLWYQGESNTQYDYLYGSQLSTMISDWRNSFGKSDLPFVVIQLPNYLQLQTYPIENLPWPTIREAQLGVTQKDNAAGMVTTIDLGDAGDIHPKNKQDVGYRTALVALGRFYGKTLAYSGPIYQGMSTEGSKVRIKFSHVGNGLMVGSKTGLEPVKEISGGTLKGFAIAGADGNFVWADAVIDGNSVVVSSASVAEPKVVRYSWAVNPLGNLYNKDGLPASPFRTDGPYTPIKKGDVNVDGEINSLDFSQVKMHLMGKTLLTGESLEAADVDGNGTVDALDLVQIKKYLLGMIKEF